MKVIHSIFYTIKTIFLVIVSIPFFICKYIFNILAFIVNMSFACFVLLMLAARVSIFCKGYFGYIGLVPIFEGIKFYFTHEIGYFIFSLVAGAFIQFFLGKLIEPIHKIADGLADICNKLVASISNDKDAIHLKNTSSKSYKGLDPSKYENEDAIMDIFKNNSNFLSWNTCCINWLGKDEFGNTINRKDIYNETVKKATVLEATNLIPKPHVAE